MNSETPLTCNMGVFTPDQRELHIETARQLVQAIQSVDELPDGYQFTFPNATALIPRIAEFIANERLCCPFLKFSLEVTSDQPISLTLVGPVGTPEFLRAEFGGAFQ